MKNKPYSLDQGILIENKGVIIPWQTRFKKIDNFGQPDIINSEQRSDAVWKEVQIFNGISVDLVAIFWHSIFGRNKLNSVHAYFDECTFETFKDHFAKKYNQEGKLRNKNRLEYYYFWKRDQCKIVLGKGDRFGTYYYLRIKKCKWP
ncbi:hypothetical protein V6R21_10220 [Limibacter armeniacum]|uniref:hypothetical protein n=1 Tax=Limibacter armeniacum TaxID=466084 RepID=UPI002FE630DB